MANFGANIVMQNAGWNRQQGENAKERLLKMAQMAQQQGQFDQSTGLEREKLEYKRANPDLSMSERDLQMVQRFQSGDTSPEVMSYIQGRAAMEGQKTQYSPDEYGNVRATTSPNPFDLLLNRSQGGAQTETTSPTAALFDMAQNPQSIPDGPMSPEQWAQMAVTGSALPEDVPILSPASDTYNMSPKGDVKRGEANIAVQQAGSMLPVKKEEERIKTDEQLRKKREEMEMVREANKPSKLAESDILTEDIGRALDVLNSPGILPKTGTVGDWLSGYSETGAGRLETHLKSVKNLVGFGKLSQMRENSPTGSSGLGALSETEMTGLQSTGGNLELRQRAEDLDYNLKRLHNQQMDLVHGTPEHIAKVAQEKNLPPELVEKLSFRYDLRTPQSIQEGQTATNPQTGERIVFQNGQWGPMQ